MVQHVPIWMLLFVAGCVFVCVCLGGGGWTLTKLLFLNFVSSIKKFRDESSTNGMKWQQIYHQAVHNGQLDPLPQGFNPPSVHC